MSDIPSKVVPRFTDGGPDGWMQSPTGEFVRYDDIKHLLHPETSDVGCHGLDNARQVFFYEQNYYVLSNFSAFMIQCNGLVFPTSEHAYHWDKFPDDPLKQRAIQVASSAHDAFKMAERWKQYRRPDWDEIKVGIMRGILRLKAEQHEYVRRKLLGTGDRELIENSWRDDFWGWGPNRDGENMLGKLWMELRTELRASVKAAATVDPTTRMRSHHRRQPFHSTQCICADCEQDNAAEQAKTPSPHTPSIDKPPQ